MRVPVSSRIHSLIVANGTSLSAGEDSTRSTRASGGNSFKNAAKSAVFPMPISPYTTRAETCPGFCGEPTTP